MKETPSIKGSSKLLNNLYNYKLSNSKKIRESLDYYIGSYNPGVNASRYMTFESSSDGSDDDDAGLMRLPQDKEEELALKKRNKVIRDFRSLVAMIGKVDVGKRRWVQVSKIMLNEEPKLFHDYVKALRVKCNNSVPVVKKVNLKVKKGRRHLPKKKFPNLTSSDIPKSEED
jgi:hypothetical protein